MTTKEDFRALLTPDSKPFIPGMNFKNLKNLKTLKILKTRKKLRLDRSKLNENEIKAGIDRTISIKSNLFQLDFKYCEKEYILIFTISSAMNNKEKKLSNILIKYICC